ncbi:MAG: DegT/DnrJ/EryC1/StrS family aminotransferase [Nitrospirota bacterium]|nr:DegT/DnrJ/EryC1/StrS family aminotransferase [Nitrospirota bacterium]
MPLKKFIPFSLPLIEKEEIEEILDTLNSCWITTGPKVKKFEDAFARYIGSKHAVAVNSCTAALHLALDAIGIKKGDEVITSPMTFASSAEVIRYFSATHVLVDIVKKRRHKVENRRKLKAIIPVHYAGYPCEMDSIMQIARNYDLKVIEDAAHAFPTFYKGKIIGTIGDITCFSFYATKNITTGEGGMITTENGTWAERMQIMSLHGISKDAWKRYTSAGNWYYEIIAPGYKYNLTDIAAALGIAQLKKADKLWQRRTEIAMMYNKAFKDLPEIETPNSLLYSPYTLHLTHDSQTRHSWHLYVIKLNCEYLSIDREQFIEELRARGIGTSVHFIPLHIHPYYRRTYKYRPEDFPVSYETYKKIVSLPIYPKMTDNDVERVIEAVTDVIAKNRR